MTARARTRTARTTRIRRDPSDRVVAGVCAAIARELGIDPVILRVAFIGAALAGGIGVALYAIAWLLIPATGAETREAMARPAPARGGARPLRVATGLGMLVLALLLGVRRLGLPFSDTVVWPVVLASAAAGLIWYRSATSRPRRREPAPSRTRGWFPVTPGRLALGAVFAAGAVTAFLVTTGVVTTVREGLLWGAALVAALALVVTPLLWRLAASLGEERAERIRTQERAEVAAHLHDSVLQTLALVQRQAADPRAVAALARRQERELRAWLWGGGQDGPDRFAAALEAAAAEVEDAHGVPIDVVAVGDRELEPRVAALVAAAREAMVNAAKFAAPGPVSVYAEVTPTAVEVFVRDRGPGFDPAAVPAGRHGLRDSVMGRMDRHGGRAAVHSGPGGTEVELTLPVEAA